MVSWAAGLLKEVARSFPWWSSDGASAAEGPAGRLEQRRDWAQRRATCVVVAILLGVLVVHETRAATARASHRVLQQDAEPDAVNPTEAIPESTLVTRSNETLPEFNVALDRELTPDEDPEAVPGQPSYTFEVTGFDLQTLTREQWSTLCQCPPGSSWGASPRYAFIVSLSPETPAGIYSLVLNLPDGRSARATITRESPPSPTSPQLVKPENSTPATAARPEGRRCLGRGLWWDVPSDGPVFQFTPSVSELDRELIQTGTLAAMSWLENATGYDVKEFNVVGFAGVEEYAEAQGISMEQAAVRARMGEQCGYNAMDTTGPDWRTGGDHRVSLAHGYFHMVQFALADSVGGVGSRNSAPTFGPVWMLEGGAVYFSIASTSGPGVKPSFRPQGSSVCFALPELESQHGMYDYDNSRTYALAAWATEYLVSLSDLRSFVGFWEEIGNRVQWQLAFEHKFGRTIGDFYVQFENHRRSSGASCAAAQ